MEAITPICKPLVSIPPTPHPQFALETKILGKGEIKGMIGCGTGRRWL